VPELIYTQKKEKGKMSNPDNTSDKDFVMSDGDASEDIIDNNGNEIYESVNVPHKKTSSMPSIIAAVGFLILIILLIAVLSKTQDLAEKKQQDPGPGRKKAAIGPGAKT
jgi:hypothetical protein